MKTPHIINVRRWFQKSYGNTYHIVEILDEDGSQIAASGITYGYGDQWKTTAECLIEKTSLAKWMQDNGLKHSHGEAMKIVQNIESNVADVKRKKDLAF